MYGRVLCCTVDVGLRLFGWWVVGWRLVWCMMFGVWCVLGGNQREINRVRNLKRQQKNVGGQLQQSSRIHAKDE